MEKFVVVTENGKVSKEYATQKEAVKEAKKIAGAWVENRGGNYDGEIAWMPR